MHLNEIEQGAYYMVENPARRIVRVLDETQFSKAVPSNDPESPGIRQVNVKCLRVRATIPAVAIDGLVGANAVKRGRNQRRALAGLDEDTDHDGRIWVEIWAERSVGTPKQVPGGKAMQVSTDPEDIVTQVYCAALMTESGDLLSGPSPVIEGSVLRRSGLVNASVEPLKKIEQMAIKEDPFDVSLDTPEGEELKVE